LDRRRHAADRGSGDSRPANACVVYDDAGRRAARYDKIHLFDVDLPGGREGYRESANAVPGKKAVVVDTPAGRLGLTVCYDLRFPEAIPANLVSEGAEIFSVPSAFTGPTGARTGKRCCARARSRTCPSWSPPRRAGARQQPRDLR
jgi:predicted amidohydrolase